MSGSLAADAQGSPYAELVEAFLERWADLTVRPQALPRGNTWVSQAPVAQHAYLLLGRWRDNPLAQNLEGLFPKWVLDRIEVPDPHFRHDPDSAPLVLELPEELVLGAHSEPAKRHCQAVRHWLAQCLEYAAYQAAERTTAQDFCGLVVSSANERSLVRHWASLGLQCPPNSGEAVLFRYQDPRVMQRLWPALSAAQQAKWLGPVTQWWSLQQPWGPYNAPQPSPRWFQARASALPSDVQAGGSPRDMFDHEQWFLAGVAPAANLIWRGYADSKIPPEIQPAEADMLQMLADGQRHGLRDENLDDYVWLTWMHAPTQGPPRAMDWGLPHTAPVLDRILAQLQMRPGASFAAVLNNIMQSHEKSRGR